MPTPDGKDPTGARFTVLHQPARIGPNTIPAGTVIVSETSVAETAPGEAATAQTAPGAAQDGAKTSNTYRIVPYNDCEAWQRVEGTTDPAKRALEKAHFLSVQPGHLEVRQVPDKASKLIVQQDAQWLSQFFGLEVVPTAGLSNADALHASPPSPVQQLTKSLSDYRNSLPPELTAQAAEAQKGGVPREVSRYGYKIILGKDGYTVAKAEPASVYPISHTHEIEDTDALRKLFHRDLKDVNAGQVISAKNPEGETRYLYIPDKDTAVGGWLFSSRHLSVRPCDPNSATFRKLPTITLGRELLFGAFVPKGAAIEAYVPPMDLTTDSPGRIWCLYKR